MVRISWKNIYSKILIASLSLVSSCIFEGIFNPSLAQSSTENKQLTNRVGQFTLIYKPSSNEEYQALQEYLKKIGLFDNIIARLNNSGLVMRTDIPVIFQDCGMVNAFYDSKNQSITMCHELFLQMKTDFIKMKKISAEQALDDSIYASVFVFYHELGHALIDVLPLPTVGKEEDTVDQFSAVMLLNIGDDELATEAIINAANWFKSAPKVPAWSEHAPNDVRFYNLLCLVYGSNPEQYKVIEKTLPQERAVRCPSEYNKVNTSWTQLLLPHFAEINRPWGNSNNATTPNTPSRGVRRGRIW